MEHDDLDFSNTNITQWAQRKGYHVTQTYVCNREKLPSLDEVDWLMVMGGSPHAWEENVHPWLREEKMFISDAMTQGKRIFGICLGAQLVAEALGGSVFPNKQSEIGWHVVHLTEEGERSFLFQRVPKKFATFHWHSDHFRLPPGCVRLAYSEPTANQAFLCTSRPVAGVQFHPEYTRDMIGYAAREEGDSWVRGQYVGGRQAVLRQTEKMRDTYWLMEALLNNMEREWRAF